jgi:predicted RecB family endonuclease
MASHGTLPAMAENVENLVLEMLRRLDKKVDGLVEDVREVRTNQGALLQLLVNLDNHVMRMDGRLGSGREAARSARPGDSRLNTA